MTAAGRRGLAVATALAVLGLAMVAVAGSVRWITAVPADPSFPGSARLPLKGSTLVPAAVPLALVGVAGLIAAAAAGRMVRGVLRLAASVIVVLAGAGLAYLAWRVAADPGPTVRDLEIARQASATLARDASPLRWLSGLGGLVIGAAGVVALVVGGGWPGLAARYERGPAEGRPAPSDSPSAVPGTAWDALERGDDPTR
jgi:uncharacterized membrane protein (TIGR02234 family)